MGNSPRFDGRKWVQDPSGLEGLDAAGPVMTSVDGRDRGVRLRDVEGDGICELIVGNERQNAKRHAGVTCYVIRIFRQT